MLATLLTLLTAGAPAPQGPSTTFLDETFANGTWGNTSFVVGPGTVTATGTQLQDGNPAPAYRLSSTFVASGNTQHYLTSLGNASTYDPAASGAIGLLSFDFDYRAQHNHRVHLVAEQNGARYIAVGPATFIAFASTSWQTWGPFVLRRDDFVERLGTGSNPNSHPDFTSAGAPITFGLETSSNSVGPITHTIDFDNFRVEINGAPGAIDSRTGTPANPDVFRAAPGTTGAIGTMFTASVDHSAFVPAATLDFVALSLSPANISTPYGLLLCSSTNLRGFGVVAGQPFVFPIPNTLDLVGLAFCLQAGSGDVAQGLFLLTNALDVSVGTY